MLHKGKDTTTAPETGEADLGAAEDSNCNDNNHDDNATVTVKITAKQWFADTKLCILNTICSYLVQTIKKSFDTRIESLENSLNCNPLPGDVDVTHYRAQLLERHKKSKANVRL